jgi:hypothetical protein
MWSLNFASDKKEEPHALQEKGRRLSRDGGSMGTGIPVGGVVPEEEAGSTRLKAEELDSCGGGGGRGVETASV